MYWIGKIPENIRTFSREDTVRYFKFLFQYSYEYMYLHMGYSKEEKESLLKSHCSELNFIEDNQKFWGALVLKSIKDIADKANFTYLSNLSENIIVNIGITELKDMESYINHLNFSLISEGIPAFAVRIYESEKLCTAEQIKENGSDVFLNKRKNIEKAFEQYIKLQDFNVVIADHEEYEDFMPVYQQLQELFVSMFSYICEIKGRSLDVDMLTGTTLDSIINWLFKPNKNIHKFKHQIREILLTL